MRRKLDGLLHGDHQGLVPGRRAPRRRRPAVRARRRRAPHRLEPHRPVRATARADHDRRPRARDLDRRRRLARASTSAPRSTRSATWRSPRRPRSGSSPSRAGNRVGAVVVRRDRHHGVVAARAGATRCSRCCTASDRPRRGRRGTASLAAALRRVRRSARRRGARRRGVRPARRRRLGHGAARARGAPRRGRRHVADPREAELPPVGLLTLVDPETGRRVEVQTAHRRSRERFAAAAVAQRAAGKRAVRSAGAGYLVLSTDRDWLLDVVRFAAMRRRRR